MWPTPPVVEAVDPTPPDLRVGRAAHLTQFALEPFYKDDTAELATTMHTQRCNEKNYRVVVANSLRKDVIHSLTTFFSPDDFLCMYLISFFSVKLHRYIKFGNSLRRKLNAAQPPSLLSGILAFWWERKPRQEP